MTENNSEFLKTKLNELKDAIGLKTLNQEIIEMALEKTPTGGNTKPFIWTWSKNQLLIHQDLKFATHYLNRNQHTSWIALGCMIKSVEIAANDQGWEIQTKLTTDVGAEISFFQSRQIDSKKEKLAKLLSRTTYRGLFEPSSEPKILPTEQPGIQAHVSCANSIISDFKNFMVSADTYLWIQKKAALSFFNEVRFFDHRISLRGIRSEDLGVGLIDQLILYVFSFVPWLLSLIIHIPILNFNFKNASRRNMKNAHYLLVTAQSLDSNSLVRAGQEAMRQWINLEEQGYKVQPCSLASITLVDAATNCLPLDTHQKFRDLFRFIGPDILRRQFNLDPAAQPIWLLRVGRSLKN